MSPRTHSPVRTTTQPRVPAGVTTGGQWAVDRRDEPPPLHLDDDTAAEMIGQAYASARFRANGWGAHGAGQVDDNVQDALLDVLEAAARRGKMPDNVNGYIHATVMRRPALGTPRQLVAAQRVLAAVRDAENAHRAAHGRGFTAAELQAATEQARQDAPQHRRPSAAALESARIILGGRSLDEADDDDHTWQVAAPNVNRDAFDPGTTGEWVMTSLGEPGHRRSAIVRSAFIAIAERRGRCPVPAAGTLTESQAQVLRNRVRDRGGVGVLLGAWQRGEDGTEDLFAPFGDLDDYGRDAVAGLLADHPAYADDLWRSAVSAASSAGEDADAA